MKGTGIGIQLLQHNIVDLFHGSPSCSRQMMSLQYGRKHTHTRARAHTHIRKPNVFSCFHGGYKIELLLHILSYLTLLENVDKKPPLIAMNKSPWKGLGLLPKVHYNKVLTIIIQFSCMVNMMLAYGFSWIVIFFDWNKVPENIYIKTESHETC